MKTSVAVTLIVMGTLIILAPPASDYLHQRQLSSLIARPEVSEVRLPGTMCDMYRFGCWLAGVTMVLMAIRGSLGRKCANNPEEKA